MTSLRNSVTEKTQMSGILFPGSHFGTIWATGSDGVWPWELTFFEFDGSIPVIANGLAPSYEEAFRNLRDVASMWVSSNTNLATERDRVKAATGQDVPVIPHTMGFTKF